jgi:hypothetical protein
VIVGRIPNDADLQFVQNIIQETGRNLKDLTTRIEDHRKQIGNMHFKMPQIERGVAPLPTGDDVDENRAIVDLGILKVTNYCLEELRENGGDLVEGWARLELAGLLSGVDLHDKLKEKETLTKGEWKLLYYQVDLIKKFGSHAVVLWKLVRAHADNLVELQAIGAISSKQSDILQKKIAKRGLTSVGVKFGELPLAVKKAYLDAAQSFSREYVTLNATRFESMVQDDVANDTLSIHSFDRSNNSSPRLDALNRLDDDFKEDDRQEELNLLFKALGGVEDTTEQQVQDLRNSLGILRARTIAAYLKLDPESVGYVAALRKGAATLLLLDGSIVHLFSALKETFDLVALKRKPCIRKEILKQLILSTKAYPDFFYKIKKAGELGALSPTFIAILAHVAEGFTQEEKEMFNRLHPLQEWIRIDRAPSPSLPGRNSSRLPSAPRDRSESEIELGAVYSLPPSDEDEQKHPD